MEDNTRAYYKLELEGAHSQNGEGKLMVEKAKLLAFFLLQPSLKKFNNQMMGTVGIKDRQVFS